MPLFLLRDGCEARQADGADKALDDVLGGAHGDDDDVIGLDRRIGRAAGEDIPEIHRNPLRFCGILPAKHDDAAVIG